jgi:hypothetical protein
LSATLLTGMTGISLHMQWPLTSQSSVNLRKRVICNVSVVKSYNTTNSPVHFKNTK